MGGGGREIIRALRAKHVILVLILNIFNAQYGHTNILERRH